MIRTLQNKFILISMLSVLLVLTVIIGSINIINYRSLTQDADAILSILSENNGEFPESLPRPDTAGPKLQDPPANPPLRRDLPPKSFHMSPEMPYETRFFSVLLTQDGTASSANIEKIAAIDAKEAFAYAQKAWQSPKSSGFLSSYRYLRKTVPDGTLVIFVDCRRNLSTFSSFLFTSILISLLGLLSVFALVVFFSRLAMKPVSDSYEKQRRFITDAGHEIKTPITIIDANREILEMEYGENEWSESIGRQTARLAELTDSLIYLSRMEEAKSRLQSADFNISDVAAETAEAFRAPAERLGKRFSIRITPSLAYCGDKDSVRRLFSVLLDNAIKYSPPQGLIEASLDRRGKNIRFTVYNTAETISQESLPRLFDRFYRTDGSRNSETGGYGIGLSIARAIVTAHKGRISAESRDGRSLLITVIL